MIKTYKPTSEGQRARKTLVRDVSSKRPEKALTKPLKGPAGRSYGFISSRHKQRGNKKQYRMIDFKRNKLDIPAIVAAIEYDPNRGAHIALLNYADGEKRYILAPEGLAVGTTIISGENAEPILGNALPLSKVPLGSLVHNVEINPGAGGVLVRGAGNGAIVMAREGEQVNLKLPSGEVKQILSRCFVTMGTLTNMDLRNTQLGKAGRARHLGKRPSVRGVAMADPHHDHPHAGKYGKTGIGRPAPMTPWGKLTRGVKTRKRKRTNYTIITRRPQKKK